jgi:hypothetical protein
MQYSVVIEGADKDGAGKVGAQEKNRKRKKKGGTGIIERRKRQL